MLTGDLDTKPRRHWTRDLISAVKAVLIVLGLVLLASLIVAPFLLASDPSPSRDAFHDVAERICGPRTTNAETPPTPEQTERYFNCLTQRLLASEGN